MLAQLVITLDSSRSACGCQEYCCAQQAVTAPHLSCVHAMADHFLVRLLWGQVADPAAHQIQDHCIIRNALPVQLRHLQASCSVLSSSVGEAD